MPSVCNVTLVKCDKMREADGAERRIRLNVFANPSSWTLRDLVKVQRARKRPLMSFGG